MRDSGEFDAMPKKEALHLSRELAKLERNLGGIQNMDKLPSAVFVLDTKKEVIAVTEANKLGVPIIAVVDTNCDPDLVQFVIPGNDDAIRAGDLMARIISDAVEEGSFIRSRMTGDGGPPQRSADEEAAKAEEQTRARQEAAAQAAERERRVAAQNAARRAAAEDAGTSEATERDAGDAGAAEDPAGDGGAATGEGEAASGPEGEGSDAVGEETSDG